MTAEKTGAAPFPPLASCCGASSTTATTTRGWSMGAMPMNDATTSSSLYSPDSLRYFLVVPVLPPTR